MGFGEHNILEKKLIEDFDLLKIKAYRAAPEGETAPSFDDLKKVIEKYELTETPVVLPNVHGVAILTSPGWINLDMYIDPEAQYLAHKHLFEKQGQNFEEVDIRDGPVCDVEKVIFGYEGRVRLQFLRGEIGEKMYLSLFLPQEVI